MTDDKRNHLKNRLQKLTDRLRVLELQKDEFGLSVPPHIVTSIQETKNEIEQIETQIADKAITQILNSKSSTTRSIGLLPLLASFVIISAIVGSFAYQNGLSKGENKARIENLTQDQVSSGQATTGTPNSSENSILVSPEITTTPTSSVRIEPGTSREGTLAKDGTAEFSFEGLQNVSMLFDINTDFWHNIKIYDSVGIRIYDQGFYAGQQQIPFTPKKDSTYTIKITSTNRVGKYTMLLKQLNAVDTRDVLIPVKIDTGETGALGDEGYRTYGFSGRINQQVKVTLQAKFWFKISIYDPEGKEVTSTWAYGGTESLSFTQKTQGVYSIKVSCFGGFGDYTLAVESLN